MNNPAGPLAKLRHSPLTLAAACFVAMGAYGASVTHFGPSVTTFQDTWEVSRGTVGTLYAVFSVFFLAAVVFGGWIYRRLGGRRMMLWSVGGMILGAVSFALSGHVALALVAMALSGLSGGAMEAVANTAISEAFTRQRSFYLNLLHMFFGFGAVIGPRMAGYSLASSGHWRGAYLASAGLMLIAYGLGWLYDGYAPAEDTTPATKSPRRSLEPQFWLVFLAMAVYVGTEVTINNWSPTYMEEVLGLTKAEAATNLSFYFLFFAGGRLVCSWLSRTIAPQQIVLCLSLGSVGAFLLALSVPGWAMFLVMPLLGLCFSGLFANLLALGGALFPEDAPKATATLVTAMGAGNLVFPWLVGSLSESLGIARAMGIMVWALVAVAAVGYWATVTPLRKRSPSVA